MLKPKPLCLLLLSVFMIAPAIAASKYEFLIPLGEPSASHGESGEKPSEIPSGSSTWLAFFQQQGSLTSYSTLSQWRAASSKGHVELAGLTLRNNLLPSGILSVDEIYDLDMSNNSLSNVDFMHGVKKAHDISLAGNDSIDLRGLSQLESVGTLDVKMSGLNNIQFLSNVRILDELNIGDAMMASGITELTPLSNISRSQSGGKIKIVFPYSQELLIPSNRERLMPLSAPFCMAASNNMVDTYVYLDIGEGYVDYPFSIVGNLCKSDHLLLEYLHAHAVELDKLKIQHVVDWSNIGLFLQERYDQDVFNSLGEYKIPGGKIGDITISTDMVINSFDFMTNINEAQNFSMSRNGTSNLNGLRNLSKVGHLSIFDNPILSDLSAFSNLRQASSIELSIVPKITDMSPFSGVNTPLRNLHVYGTGVSSLKGLENIPSAESLGLANNVNLTDISQIANLILTGGDPTVLFGWGEDTEKYLKFPLASSPFCKDLLANKYRITGSMKAGSGYRDIVPSDICH